MAPKLAPKGPRKAAALMLASLCSLVLLALMALNVAQNCRAQNLQALQKQTDALSVAQNRLQSSMNDNLQKIATAGGKVLGSRDRRSINYGPYVGSKDSSGRSLGSGAARRQRRLRSSARSMNNRRSRARAAPMQARSMHRFAPRFKRFANDEAELRDDGFDEVAPEENGPQAEQKSPGKSSSRFFSLPGQQPTTAVCTCNQNGANAHSEASPVAASKQSVSQTDQASSNQQSSSSGRSKPTGGLLKDFPEVQVSRQDSSSDSTARQSNPNDTASSSEPKSSGDDEDLSGEGSDETEEKTVAGELSAGRNGPTSGVAKLVKDKIDLKAGLVKKLVDGKAEVKKEIVDKVEDKLEKKAELVNDVIELKHKLKHGIEPVPTLPPTSPPTYAPPSYLPSYGPQSSYPAQLKSSYPPIVPIPGAQQYTSSYPPQHLASSQYKSPVQSPANYNQYSLYESRHVEALPEHCRGRVRDLGRSLHELLVLVEQIVQKSLADSSLDFGRRDLLSRKLAKIRAAAEESLMAAQLAKLRLLNDVAKVAGIELIRLSNFKAALALEPNLKRHGAKLRRVYGYYRKSCKSVPY